MPMKKMAVESFGLRRHHLIDTVMSKRIKGRAYSI